jgi:ribosomal protein L37AE/L43A
MERDNDRRAMAANRFKMCPTCGRKVHISVRFKDDHPWTCSGCGGTWPISDWPDVPEDEARKVGRIIDRTPRPERGGRGRI